MTRQFEYFFSFDQLVTVTVAGPDVPVDDIPSEEWAELDRQARAMAAAEFRDKVFRMTDAEIGQCLEITDVGEAYSAEEDECLTA